MARKDVLKGRSIVSKNIFETANESIDEIKRANPIVLYFESKGVKLIKSGEEYKGLCPFHNDHNPSLSVNDVKQVFKCFGCGKSGTVIDACSYFENISIGEAVKLLGSKKQTKNDDLFPSLNSKEEADENQTDNDLKLDLSDIELPEEVKEDEISLTILADHWHKELYNHPEAIEYLHKRGVTNPEIIQSFKIGFSDGKSLLKKLSKNQVGSLIEKSILRKNGQEAFANCLIFPLLDEFGQVVHFYARNIDDNAKVKHLYLSGSHKSVFNRKVIKAYTDRLILTESIIDALSLIQLGINNVWSCYGVQTFTDEMLSILKEHRVKEIVTAFDNDEAGKTGAEKLREKLIENDFTVRSIFPQDKKDWNEELINATAPNNVAGQGITADAVNELIDKAEVFKKSEVNEKFIITFNDGVYVFLIDGITYRLAGIKDIFAPNLKVKIRVESGDKYHRDYLDLYPYRSRQNFSNVASGRLDVNSAKIEKDLDKILDYFEEEREKKTSTQVNEDSEVMTEEDIKKGMEFLKSPDLVNLTITDITNIGYAGEDNNKLLVYVIGISRNLPKPLSLFALSSPGSGKSYLVDTTLKLFPPERIKHNASLSDQAFHYMPESDFDGNIFVMGESLHNPIIEGYIRQMQTENMLSRGVVKKDEQTGEMKTINITHKVRLVFMTTSTHFDPNIENISRCILLKIDESSDQTERVHKRQRYKRTHEGILADRHVIPQIIKKHIISQRLLKPVMIVNPFAEYIDFPKHKSILRRSQEHFLITIESICFWRQYQKEAVKKFNPYLKADEDFIECDLIDYELARKLFIECRLLSGIEEIPDQMVFLYDEIRKMLRAKAKKENLTTEEIIFSQGDVREIENLQMGNVSIKRYIRMLVDYEFLLIAGKKQNGVKNNYRLKQDLPIKKINVAEIIPTVQAIKEMMKGKN